MVAETEPDEVLDPETIIEEFAQGARAAETWMYADQRLRGDELVRLVDLTVRSGHLLWQVDETRVGTIPAVVYMVLFYPCEPWSQGFAHRVHLAAYGGRQLTPVRA
jgi:hypothetical protein